MWDESGAVGGDDECMDESTEWSGPCVQCSLKTSIRAPGLEHSCVNAQQQLLTRLSHYPSWHKSAKAIARFLSSKFYNDLVIQKNLQSPALQWLADKLRSFNRISHAKRFGTIVSFLEDIYPLQQGLRTHLDLSEWDIDEESAGKKDHDGEAWCDLPEVLKALKGNLFWKYGLMVLSLAAGVGEVRNFSRGCVCHRPPRPLDSVYVTSYFKRLRIFQQETGLKEACPGKGLIAPWLASGEHIKILSASHDSLQQLLWNDLVGLNREERAIIMTEFDQGRAHCSYVMTLKMSDWQTLPLKMAAMAHLCEAVARDGARACRHQYLDTAAKPELHSHYTIQLFREFPLKAQLLRFIEGTARADLPRLDDYTSQFAVVRANDVSIERLHRLGELETHHAPHHSEAYI